MFLTRLRTLADTPAASPILNQTIQAFAKHTPKRLRMTCFSAFAERYGPQYLVETFGLSLTQAACYGKMEEYLLEEEVKQQRGEFLALSRQLEQQAPEMRNELVDRF